MEVEEEEVEEVSAQEESDNFAAGFEDDDGTVTPTETPAETGIVEEQVPDTRMAQITEQEWEAMKALSLSVNSIRETADRAAKGADTVGGNYGELRRILTEMQSSTPNGVEATVEDFAEMSEDFPELAKLQVDGINKVLNRMKGAPSAQAFDPAEVQGVIGQAFQEQIEENAKLQLGWMIPDWQEVCGEEHSNTDYRQWLATQDQGYQEQMATEQNPFAVVESIRNFQSDTEVKPGKEEPRPKTPTRESRLKASVQPRGVGGNPPMAQTLTEDDAFKEGFEKG